MKELSVNAGRGIGDGPSEGRKDEIQITINGRGVSIHRGHTTVLELKNAGNIPLVDDLEEVIDGRLKPLPDNGAVTLKGGEVFVSHPKDSGSSHWTRDNSSNLSATDSR